MKRFLRALFGVAACTVAAASAQAADDWVNLATVSMTNATTPKLTNRYVCYSDGTDVACNAPSLYVTTGGLVGIGTASSAYALDISGTARIATGSYLRFGGAAASDMFLVQSGDTLQLFKGDASAFGTFTAQAINAMGSGSGFNVFRRDNNVQAGTLYSAAGKLSLYSSGLGGDALTIDTSGNVGIGTANPTAGAKLQVSGGRILIDNSQYLQFGLSGDPNGGAGFVMSNPDDSFSVWTSAYATPVIIDASKILLNTVSNGKVGIGWITPSVALEVSGTISATNFVGNGSGLTGIVAASSDRITSGTAMVIVNSATGYTSFSTGGVTTGYYSPGGILSSVGISTSSNQASFTTVYASGNASIAGQLTGPSLVSTSNNGTVSGTYIYGRYASFTDIAVANGITANAVAWGNVTGKPVSLTDLIALVPDDGVFAVGDGTTWTAESGATARTSLGLGTMATQNANAVAITGGDATGLTSVSATYLYGNQISGTSGYFPTATINALGAGNIAMSGNLTGAALVSTATGGTVSATYGYFDQISASNIAASSVAWGGITGKPASIVSLSGISTSAANHFIMGDGTSWTVVNAVQGRSGLGLGTMATQNANAVAITGGDATGLTSVSATYLYGNQVSGTSGYFPTATITALSAGSIGANVVSSSLVSATNISGTMIQVGAGGTCASSVSGSIRYGAASNTLQICTGTGWVSLSSGTSSAVAVGGISGSLQFNNGASSLGGRSDLLIDSSGRMGVGNATPLAKLDIIGTISASDAIQVSGSSLTCSSAIKGAIRYSNTSSTLEYCNSTAWTSLGPSATDVPAFSVNKAGSDQVVTQGVATKLTWSTEVFDTNNNFASNRFTPTLAGKYLFTLAAACGDNGNSYCIAAIYKNGVTVANAYITGASNQAPQASILLDMNGSTDYVEAYSVNSSGTNVSGAVQNTHFEGTMIASGNGLAGGGGATPGGTDTQIQFNDGGSTLGGDADYTWNKTSNVLTVTGTGSATVLNSLNGSITTLYNPGTYSGNAMAANNAVVTNISVTAIHITATAVMPSLSFVSALGGNGNRIASGTTNVTAHTAGSITFTTGGSQRAVIDSSGNVGIGTANPVANSNQTGVTINGTSFGRVDLYSGGSPRAYWYAGSSGSSIGAAGATYLAFDTNGTERMRIDGSGNVGIGVAPGITGLDVLGKNIRASLPANPAGNTMCYDGSNVFGYCSSDRRLKSNIAAIVSEKAMLDAVLGLRPVTFKWKADVSRTYAGFIAQEVGEAVPLAVHMNPTGYYELDNTALTAYLVGGMKALKADNDNLRLELDELREELQDLRRGVLAERAALAGERR